MYAANHEQLQHVVTKCKPHTTYSTVQIFSTGTVLIALALTCVCCVIQLSTEGDGGRKRCT